ncbi:zinc-binding dehydrogenase [Mesorhizobium sp. M0923]|uniref:zinc-binding dehydrogenase n=1 Tax=unclassified Mesorhizobium TaxID=325217 RepID=UPI000A0EE52E|nr:zinc-binding dehydrogenase [Mesorhizobium sp. L48C026A00]
MNRIAHAPLADERFVRDVHRALYSRYREAVPNAGCCGTRRSTRLLDHRSVRAFKTDGLPRGALETIVAVAHSAPPSSKRSCPLGALSSSSDRSWRRKCWILKEKARCREEVAAGLISKTAREEVHRVQRRHRIREEWVADHLMIAIAPDIATHKIHPAVQILRGRSIAGGEQKCRHVVVDLGFDECVDHRAADFPEKLAQAVPIGIDVYFDTVGGVVLNAVLKLGNPFSRIALCGMITDYNNDCPYGITNLYTAIANRTLLQAS